MASFCESESVVCGKIDTCIFDVDDTLYPRSKGIADVCKDRIEGYMVEKLGFNPATVVAENMRLYKRYGTTMAGLRAEGHAFDFDDWHNYVHVPLPYDVLRPDPELRNLLHSMPQRKFVFSNADKGHAARCISRLGLEDCFQAVLTFEEVMACQPVREFSLRDELPVEEGGEAGTSREEDVVASWQSPAGPLICCKPQVEAFQRALMMAGATASHTMMFDDSIPNIIGAKRTGMKTVLVGSTARIPGADHSVASIHNIHGAVPELWEGLETDEHNMCTCEDVRVQAVRA